MPFDVEKLEWCGYPTVKKFENMFTSVQRIPACDKTDGRTDILPQHSPRYAYASRGKNDCSGITDSCPGCGRPQTAHPMQSSIRKISH